MLIVLVARQVSNVAVEAAIHGQVIGGLVTEMALSHEVRGERLSRLLELGREQRHSKVDATSDALRGRLPAATEELDAPATELVPTAELGCPTQVSQ